MKVPKARKLPSGSWFCRVRVDGRDVPITRNTKKEAEQAAILAKYAAKQEADNPHKITLETAYKRYIEMKDGVLSPSTITGYKRLSKNTFQPLMKLRLDQLTTEKIQKEISALSKAGKSQKYIANASGLLSSVLKAFYGDFRYNVTLPAKEKKTQRALSNEEIKGIMAAVKGTDVELPVLMGLWLGMRMSEIRGATYKDIDGDRLHICRAIVDTDSGAIEKSPKTFSGDRWVNLPSYIKSLIPPLKCKTDHIVNMTGAMIYKRFVAACDNAGIPHCKFHDLRHANAAVMIQLGIDSKYAQERNGWKSDYMYKQVYGYVMDDTQDKNSKAINEYFVNVLATEN